MKIWFLDLLKSIVAFGVTAILTVFVLNKCEDNRMKKHFIWTKNYELKLGQIKDFQRSSLELNKAITTAFENYVSDTLSPSFSHTRPAESKWTDLKLSLEAIKGSNFGIGTLSKLEYTYDSLFQEINYADYSRELELKEQQRIIGLLSEAKMIRQKIIDDLYEELSKLKNFISSNT